jgi:hypothetical protein
MKKMLIKNPMAKIQRKEDSNKKKIQRLGRLLIQQVRNKKNYKTKERMKEFTFISQELNSQVYLISQVNLYLK